MFELALLIDNNTTDNISNKERIIASGLAREVLIKNTGKDAISFLSTNPQIPDLIFLDINMPIVDGVVFIHEFESLPEIISDLAKIYILSSQDRQIDIRQIVDQNNIQGIVRKPLSEVDCKRILRREI